MRGILELIQGTQRTIEDISNETPSKMLRIKRLEGEDMGTFLHRANGILKDKLANVTDEHETWDTKATKHRFNWGGHVARLLRLGTNRLIYRVFSHLELQGDC